jgi:hypothetical protein
MALNKATKRELAALVALSLPLYALQFPRPVITSLPRISWNLRAKSGHGSHVLAIERCVPESIRPQPHVHAAWTLCCRFDWSGIFLPARVFLVLDLFPHIRLPCSHITRQPSGASFHSASLSLALCAADLAFVQRIIKLFCRFAVVE